MATPISRPAGAHNGRGLDYTSPPSGGAAYLKSHGYEAVARYVSPQSWKRLTRSEIADYHAHGIALLLNFESAAGNAKGGYSQGVSDARSFVSVARGLGLTGPLTGYFSVDYDVPSSGMGTVLNYLRGAGSVLGKDHVGVYGSYSVVKAAHESGAAKYLWQTYAWSGGRVYPGIHWYQYSNGHNVGGADADLNQIMFPASQWGAYGAATDPTPGPTPTPSPVQSEEDDMETFTLDVSENRTPTTTSYLRNGGVTRYFATSEFGAADVRIVCVKDGKLTAEKVVHVPSLSLPVSLCEADPSVEAISITRVAQPKDAAGVAATEGVLTVTAVHNS